MQHFTASAAFVHVASSHSVPAGESMRPLAPLLAQSAEMLGVVEAVTLSHVALVPARGGAPVR